MQQQAEEAARIQQQQAEAARRQQQAEEEAARLQQQQANAQSTAGPSDLEFLDAIEKEMKDDVSEHHEMQASLQSGSNNQQQATVAAAAAPMSSLQVAAARLKEQQQPANDIMVGQDQQEGNKNEQTEEGQGEKLFTLSESIMIDRIEDKKQAEIQQMQNRRREGARKKALQKKESQMDRRRGFKAGSSKPQQSILPGQFSSPPLQQGPIDSNLPVLTQQSQNGTGNDPTAAGSNMETGGK